MNEYKNYLRQKFGENVQVESLGHDDLGRNFVFKVNNQSIVKFYGEKKSWERELKSLNQINSFGKIYPRLLSSSRMSESLNWCEISIIKGQVADRLLSTLSDQARANYYYNLGVLHAGFHKNHKTDLYYDWAKSSPSYKAYDSYYDFEIDKSRRRGLLALERATEDHKLVIEKAYDTLIEHEKKLNLCHDFSLCHNDFSSRNIIGELVNGEIVIKGIIDFEVCYPSCIDSDIAKTYFSLYFEDNRTEYLKGYESITALNNRLEETFKYYLVSFALEVCSWSFGKARDYYDYAYRVLVDILEQEDYYVKE